MNIDLDPAWVRAVELWYTREEGFGFAEKGRLPDKDRCRLRYESWRQQKNHRNPAWRPPAIDFLPHIAVNSGLGGWHSSRKGVSMSGLGDQKGMRHCWTKVYSVQRALLECFKSWQFYSSGVRLLRRTASLVAEQVRMEVGSRQSMMFFGC